MSGIKEQQIFQEMRYISSENSQSRRFEYIMAQVKNDVTNEYDSDFVEECSSASCNSLESLSSSDIVDDASSLCPSSMSSHDGPLYELSEIMAQLPIKKGLSKYYQGKSESFGSLSNLSNIEDLAKRSNRSRKLTKSPLSPKSIIAKNKKRDSSSYVARSSIFSSIGKMSSILDIISVQNSF